MLRLDNEYCDRRLDAHNSGELKDRILKVLEEGGRNLIIDLGEFWL